MKTPERFTNAVTKLYNAFHNRELQYGSCSKCAVGNIVGSDSWSNVFIGMYLKIHGGSRTFKDIDYEKLTGKTKFEIDRTGYSVEELATVESLFLVGSRGDDDLENQFYGLCTVVEYLCQLDGIPNVMDYTCLFETEEEKPKYTLEEVLN